MCDSSDEWASVEYLAATRDCLPYGSHSNSLVSVRPGTVGADDSVLIFGVCERIDADLGYPREVGS